MKVGRGRNRKLLYLAQIFLRETDENHPLTAISSDRQIRFQYFQWNSKKEMVLRRGGAWYVTSPWILMQDNENYYLVAYDKKHDDIIHFRVDKMLRISLTKDRREGQERFQHFDVPRYARSIFGMFGGEERLVTMEADRDMAGVLIDRFGRDIPIFPAGDPARIRTCVHVDVSPQFLGWIAGLYGRVRITGPDCVVRMMREMIEILRSDYT